MKDVGDEEQECSEEWNFSLRFSLSLSDIRKLSPFRPLLTSSPTTSSLHTGFTILVRDSSMQNLSHRIAEIAMRKSWISDRCV